MTGHGMEWWATALLWAVLHPWAVLLAVAALIAVVAAWRRYHGTTGGGR